MHTAGHGAAAPRQFFRGPEGTWQKGLTDRFDWCAQAEGVGAEEAPGRSQAQKGARGGPRKSAPLSESERALSYQFSLVLALNFHNTICNVIRSTHY